MRPAQPSPVSPTRPWCRVGHRARHVAVRTTATIIEAHGRALLFLSSVSGATVVLALVAQLDRMSATFFRVRALRVAGAAGTGVTSCSRLADLAVHDAYYARAIGRIRAFYLTDEPAAAQYWLQPPGTTRTR